MWSGIDRRRFPRAQYRCLITVGKPNRERHFLTHTENIGVGGICVILGEDLGIFSEVDIELMLKDGGEPIKTRGSIVWVVKKTSTGGTSYDTGIEFMNLKTKDRKRIEDVVNKILKSEEKPKGGE